LFRQADCFIDALRSGHGFFSGGAWLVTTPPALIRILLNAPVTTSDRLGVCDMAIQRALPERMPHAVRTTPAAGHEQAVLGRRVEWLPDMDSNHD
jgi:hypothetical protein